MDARANSFRADLHIHSACSENPTAKAIRFFRSRESFTEPQEVYASARARGMDFVTITDHNTLNGSLAIAHLPGTFLGCEFDTWFPEDDCRVHVVALGIDEPTFAEAMRVKASVYDLVALLREAGVVHYLAHPLFDMTGKLTPDIVEKMLLLFNVMEGRNGARVVRCNGLLRDIAARPHAAGHLGHGRAAGHRALRRDAVAAKRSPAARTTTAGSSPPAPSPRPAATAPRKASWTPSRAATARPAGEDADARVLAHSIYATSFWRLREMLRMDTDEPRQKALGWIKQGFGQIGRDVPILEKIGARRAQRGPRALPSRGRPRTRLGGAARPRARRTGARPGRHLQRGQPRAQQAHLRRDVHARGRRAQPPSGAAARPGEAPRPGWRLRDSLFAVAMVHFLETGLLHRLRVPDAGPRATRRPSGSTSSAPPATGPRIAVFTDAAGDRRRLHGRGAAVRGRGRSDSGADPRGAHASPRPAARPFPGGMEFAASAAWPSRLQPGRTLVAPPLLDVLDYLYEQDFTAIHVDSAGGMGLAGLFAAKILHLPVTGTVHSDVLLAVERLSSGLARVARGVALRALVRGDAGRGLHADARRRAPPGRPRRRPAARARAPDARRRSGRCVRRPGRRAARAAARTLRHPRRVRGRPTPAWWSSSRGSGARRRRRAGATPPTCAAPWRAATGGGPPPAVHGHRRRAPHQRG